VSSVQNAQMRSSGLLFLVSAVMFMRLRGIPFLAVGAYLVAGRFAQNAWRCRHTVYGVTDRRVIVISGRSARSTTSHTLARAPGDHASPKRPLRGRLE